jgi:hypothetical protein
MEGGRSGMEKGCVRRAVYSSSFISEVRIRDVRPVYISFFSLVTYT